MKKRLTYLQNNKPLIARLLRISFAIAVSFILNQFPLHQWEFFGYDLLLRARPQISNGEHVAIVTIDRQTIEELRHEPDITDHKLLLQSLQKYNQM